MPDSPVEPTAQSIIELWRELSNDSEWQRNKTRIRRNLAMYYGDEEYKVLSVERTKDMVVDPGRHIVKTGMAREYTELLTGLKNVFPQHSVEPAGLGGAAQALSEKIEQFLDRLPALLERQQGEDTNYLLTAEVDLIGYSGRAVLPDLTPWRKRPKREAYAAGRPGNNDYLSGVDKWHQTAPLPILDEHIPAEGWYPLLDGRTVLKSLEAIEITRAAAKARYDYDPDGLAAEHPAKLIKLGRYIDDTYCGVVELPNEGLTPGSNRVTSASVGQFVVKPWRHYMPIEGRAPVVLYEGLITPSRQPGRRWTSVIDSLYDIFRAIDFLMSREMFIAAMWYLTTFVEEMAKDAQTDMTAQAAGDRRGADLLVGGYNIVQAGRTVRTIDPPKGLPDADKAYQKAMDRVNSAVPDVIRGIIPGDTSGYLYRQAREHALARHGPVQDRFARADAESAGLRLQAIGGVEEMLRAQGVEEIPPVAIRRRTDKGSQAITLTWDEVRDMAPLVECKRTAKLPPDRIGQLQAYETAVKNGFSRRWASREFLDLENPEEIFEERNAEDIELSEPFATRKQERVLRKLHLLDDKEQGMPLEEAAGLNLPGGIRRALGLEQAALPPGAPAGPLPPDDSVMPGPPAPAGAMPRMRINPRAGTRTQPGGPRRGGNAVQQPGASR